ncbi:hypothetical protein [uncultured Algibacter sp.]|uniref:hypothetical protein n=1 Tax=uncultured Algibacter sp. TaxID=298659 RepID=UPI00263070EA|nr:hypothetical protein [uncultured Algibacter sp.]
MKRILLVCAGLLIGLTAAAATKQNTNNPKTKFEKNKNYKYAQPITFMERGVEFLIFPDGSFDFNTHSNNDFYNDSYYRNNTRRRNINSNKRGPNSNIQYNSNPYLNRGISISRDRDGIVRRIGNVYLNYDRYGRLSRVGSIFIKYNRGRNSELTNVGGLRVKYNKRGEIIYTRGNVNRYNNRNYNNDYYYKQNGKMNKKNKR